jgi:hypothetical protein
VKVKMLKKSGYYDNRRRRMQFTGSGQGAPEQISAPEVMLQGYFAGG